MTKDRKSVEKKSVKAAETEASFEALDRVFHERARLAILTRVLPHAEGVSFVELKDHCQLTDGNLSRHLQALKEAGVIELWKRSSTGRPQTFCVITPDGRDRFLSYLDALEAVVRAAFDASRAGAGAARSSRVRPRFGHGLA